jgi:ketosteroid isomerase-like protein
LNKAVSQEISYEKERDEVVRVIETWRTSWERKDVDKYMSLYRADFSASGKSWQERTASRRG